MSEFKLVDIEGAGKKPSKPPLHFADLTPEERRAKVVELGLPAFRANQLAVHYFEHYNDDDQYIYGFATHGLFVELVSRMGAMGYTEKELRKEIKHWLNTSHGQVIH